MLIQFIGMSDGWRWVFLVNLFIGVVEVPSRSRPCPVGTNGRSTTWTSRAVRC
jgi:hypothetical protein